MLQKKRWMHLVVVTFPVNKLPDYPTCSFTGWLGFYESFCLVSNLTCHICYQGCIHQQGHSGVAPEATIPCKSFLHHPSPGLSSLEQAEEGRRGPSVTTAVCYHQIQIPNLLLTLWVLWCVHCGLTLSLSSMGPLSFHQNWQPVTLTAERNIIQHKLSREQTWLWEPGRERLGYGRTAPVPGSFSPSVTPDQLPRSAVPVIIRLGRGRCHY